MKQFISNLKPVFNAILGGVCISISAYAYLQVQGALGAFLFSFGIMAIAFYHLLSYTEIAHRTTNLIECAILTFMLFLNIAGCFLASRLVKDPYIIEICQDIVDQRAVDGFWRSLINGAGCGFIVTVAMQCWKWNIWLMVIGIPAFVLAGFTHSVADAFFYCVGRDAVTWSAILALGGTVIGNLVGSLIHKLGTEEDNNK